MLNLVNRFLKIISPLQLFSTWSLENLQSQTWLALYFQCPALGHTFRLQVSKLRPERGKDPPVVTLSVDGKAWTGPLVLQIQDRVLCAALVRPPPPTRTCARTHTHLRAHTSPFWSSAPKSRTPPTQALIGSCVPVPRHISEQVLAICTVNQAPKTITDFSCMDKDTAGLLISARTARAPHTLPINAVLRHCVL